MMSGGKLKEFELWKNFSKIINNCLLVVNLSKSEDRSFHFLVKCHECRSSTNAFDFCGAGIKYIFYLHGRRFQKSIWNFAEKCLEARKIRVSQCISLVKQQETFLKKRRQACNIKFSSVNYRDISKMKQNNSQHEY